MKSFKNWLSEGSAVAASVDTAVVKSIECDCGRDKKPGEPMCDMCKKAKNAKRNEDVLYLAGVINEGAKEEMLSKIFDARETIKNSLANMRSNPYHVLPAGLQHGLDRVAMIPAEYAQQRQKAESIIRHMQDLAVTFFQRIKNKGIGNYRDGHTIMPRTGEPGMQEYQDIYEIFQKEIYPVWDQLNAMLKQV